MLDVPGEICENNVAYVFHVAVLREGAAAADGNNDTVEEKQRLSGKGGFIQTLRDGDHLLIDRGTMFCFAPKWIGAFLAKPAQPASE